MRINWRLLLDNRDSGNGEMLLVESGILGFGNHNSVQGIRNPVTTGIWRGIQVDKKSDIQLPGILNPQRGMWNPCDY